MNGWLAAIDETVDAQTIQYPTRWDSLRGILALHDVVDID